MKLSEIRQVGEHITSVHPENVVIKMAQLKEWLAGAEQVEQGITTTDGSFLIFLNKLASNNHAFILTDRADRTEPVGYCLLIKGPTKYWMVMDVWIKRTLRGKGLVPNLYRLLVALGYKLQSGKVVSAEAENVWKKLGKLGRAKVLNTQTGDVEEFSLKPIDDTFDSSYVWVAEAQWAPKWDQQPLWSGAADRPALLEWLRNEPTPRSFGIKWPGIYEEVILFGKKNKETGSIDVLVDGNVVGQITSSKYDRLTRRSAGGGYEVSVMYKGKRFYDSDMVLQDLKHRTLRFFDQF